MKTKDELNALNEEVETVSKKPQALSDDELEQVTGGRNNQPVSADSTTCYWLTHVVFHDDYMPLDESKPQTCGNCCRFNFMSGCTSRASGC